MTKKEKSARAKREPKVKVLKLAGIFKEATTIFGSTKGKDIEARVHVDGTIVYKDKDYASPSAAANAATGQSRDGWLWWKVKDGEKVVTLGTYAQHEVRPRKERTEKKPKAEANPKRNKKAKKKAKITDVSETIAEQAVA